MFYIFRLLLAGSFLLGVAIADAKTPKATSNWPQLRPQFVKATQGLLNSAKECYKSSDALYEYAHKNGFGSGIGDWPLDEKSVRDYLSRIRGVRSSRQSLEAWRIASEITSFPDDDATEVFKTRMDVNCSLAAAATSRWMRLLDFARVRPLAVTLRNEIIKASLDTIEHEISMDAPIWTVAEVADLLKKLVEYKFVELSEAGHEKRLTTLADRARKQYEGVGDREVDWDNKSSVRQVVRIYIAGARLGKETSVELREMAKKAKIAGGAK